MTNMEHLILITCFSMNLGWLLGCIMIIITDSIHKHKIKKEQKRNEDKERIGDNL